MSITELTRLFPPPDRPMATGTASIWASIKDVRNLVFPTDFVEYITLYGDGGWYDYLGIRGPCSTTWSLFDEHESYRDHYDSNQADEPLTRMPYKLFPEEGGLLLFGGDTDGNNLYWKVAPNPDDWQLVLYVREYIDFEVFESSFTEWLLLWLNGKLESRILCPVREMSPQAVYFSPSKERG